VTPLLTVHGTWGLDHSQWWRPESLTMQRALRLGCKLPDAADPFLWSGDLGITDHAPWQVAAHALIWYCAAKALERPHVWTHSHGLQVVAYAAAWGQRFGELLDVSGPPRRDMDPIYEQARPNIARWCHVYDEGDMVIEQGQIGTLGPTRLTADLADENVKVDDHYGHSGLLTDLAALEPFLLRFVA
jgi:hypothetical protein